MGIHLLKDLHSKELNTHKNQLLEQGYPSGCKH